MVGDPFLIPEMSLSFWHLARDVGVSFLWGLRCGDFPVVTGHHLPCI